MNYLKLIIKTTSKEYNDIVVAYLADYEFNGFGEEEGDLIAYIAEEYFTDGLIAVLEELKDKYGIVVSQELIADQNWNAQWESDYEPVLVDDFCAVRATFHPAITTVKHEIIITPKMSFGTGHHATTYMMMKQMELLDFVGKSVFDYGCGTGVLAILAQKLGATTIDAVDIEEWAYKNTLENIEINQADQEIKTYEGEITAVPQKQYDIVLANINRNVILDTIEPMAARLKKGGYLLASGFLEDDISLIEAAANEQGLTLTNQMKREKWRCLTFS